MQILYGPDFIIEKPSAVAIGKFDGLHAGHLKVIDKLLKSAEENELNSVIYTFNINPKIVLNQEIFSPIMTNEEKSKALELIGLDYLVYDEFDVEFANILPEEFVKKILVDKLNAKVIIMGENSTFGKDRSGDVNLMKELGNKCGFDVEVVSLMRENGEVISSSRIRENVY